MMQTDTQTDTYPDTLADLPNGAVFRAPGLMYPLVRAGRWGVEIGTGVMRQFDLRDPVRACRVEVVG